MLYYCSSTEKKTDLFFFFFFLPRDALQGPARVGGKEKKNSTGSGTLKMQKKTQVETLGSCGPAHK